MPKEHVTVKLNTVSQS